MIAFSEFKLRIGCLAEKLSDEQIEELRVMGYQIADAVVERWLRKKAEIAASTTNEGYNIPAIEF